MHTSQQTLSLLADFQVKNQDYNSFLSSPQEAFDTTDLNALLTRVTSFQFDNIVTKKNEEDYEISDDNEDNTGRQKNQCSLEFNFSNKVQKIKPFTITRNRGSHFRVSRVANYSELFLRNLDDKTCFMLAGDFTVDRGVFLKQNSSQVEAYCPLHNYRPQVSVQTGKNYVICTLNQSYNGITDILAPVTMLKLLQNQQAFEISSFIMNYQNYINQLQLIRTNLNNAFNKEQLIEQVKANHLNSLKIAHEAMEKADKNKAYVFLYMKFDYEAGTNKLFFVGGNTKFTEAFLGQNDITLMRQYCQRYSFPHFNDVSGVLNVLYSKFQSKNSYFSNLVTFDDEVLPFEGVREFVPLHQLEIAPGLSVGDKFEMRELKFNPKVYQSVAQIRTETNQMETYLKIEDLGYTLEAEAFVNKFYKKNKKSKTNPPTSDSSSDSQLRKSCFNL
ncbi:hypothetical protein TTHERM_00469310 (macronuclear) [Tetrahymena thermophila SB210]|uniref:Uncharacterized protein n=1 Tax=Tetrahymena thermophila (strain SB210) TaxID=312017 RepID=I7MMH8_TETTS|nr:hypothetical protein TTHERM_00469310 [Tetrahymena thermophila SB210]EAS04882.1 hypothetical protein TTHERM_00469310 [Tetrahymena thermophila SB210]|eukprot:XP_001025127.1 hypothetical protein TTHERM_00469310 [Tetrahymena thermophila SB210]